MARNPVEGLDVLVRRLRAEEDGRKLRRELAKHMRTALRPAVAQAKAGIMSMSSAGLGTSSPGLRSSIAKRIRPEVKLGGRWTGARIKSRKIPGTRGFANAPKRTQAAGGWRTRTFGGEWRTQHGKTDWFDHAMEGVGPEARSAVLDAMEAMAGRILGR